MVSSSIVTSVIIYFFLSIQNLEVSSLCSNTMALTLHDLTNTHEWCECRYDNTKKYYHIHKFSITGNLINKPRILLSLVIHHEGWKKRGKPSSSSTLPSGGHCAAKNKQTKEMVTTAKIWASTLQCSWYERICDLFYAISEILHGFSVGIKKKKRKGKKRRKAGVCTYCLRKNLKCFIQLVNGILTLLDWFPK